jgi:DNA polymerase epsilon subunit 1
MKRKINESDYDLSPLEWQKEAVKKITVRFVENFAWVENQINLARYSLMPVGNLGSEAEINAIDMLYARSLNTSGHLLWYSHNSLPDLGGHEGRDFRSYFAEELDNPLISNKGFYRGYTVEININLLSTNTVLTSSSEFEEACGMASLI